MKYLVYDYVKDLFDSGFVEDNGYVSFKKKKIRKKKSKVYYKKKNKKKN